MYSLRLNLYMEGLGSGGVGKDTNPLQVVGSSYELFRPLANRVIGKEKRWHYNDQLVESLYNETCKFFEDKQELKPDGKAVLEMLKARTEPLDGTGLYLSALLNCTGLDEFVIEDFPELDKIGYRIKPGKVLVLDKGAKAHSVGDYAQGDVLNWGEAERMASHAQGGFQGNWGEVESMADYAQGGVQIDRGKVKRILERTKDLGKTPKLETLTKRLSERIAQIYFLHEFKNAEPGQYKVILDRIRTCDFPKFERDVLAKGQEQKWLKTIRLEKG